MGEIKLRAQTTRANSRATEKKSLEAAEATRFQEKKLNISFTDVVSKKKAEMSEPALQWTVERNQHQEEQRNDFSQRCSLIKPDLVGFRQSGWERCWRTWTWNREG